MQFRVIFCRFYEFILSLLMRWGCTREQAEDITQETFLRAWCCLQIDRFPNDQRAQRQWLINVAYRLMVDVHRAKTGTGEIKRTEVPLESVESTIAERDDSILDRYADNCVAAAMSAIDRLATNGPTAHMAEVFIRNRIYGEPISEIANNLKLPRWWVAHVIWITSDRLRRELARDGW